MPYKWIAPPATPTFELNGKLYAPGDLMPISKESALHHQKWTDHRWEGIDEPTPPPPSGVQTPQATAKSD